MSGLIITILFFLFVCSILLSLLELFFTHFFVKAFFNIGITVYRKTIQLSPNDFLPIFNVTYKKHEGKFRFTKDKKVYFISRVKLFRFYSQFPFRATGTFIKNNKIQVVAKTPLFYFLAAIFGISALTYGSLIPMFEVGLLKGLSLILLILPLLAILTGLILFSLNYSKEIERMEIKINELREIILHSNDS